MATVRNAPLRVTRFIPGSQGGRQVAGVVERHTSLFGEPLRDPRPEVGVGIEAGADRSAPDGQPVDRQEGAAQAGHGVVELSHP